MENSASIFLSGENKGIAFLCSTSDVDFALTHKWYLSSKGYVCKSHGGEFHAHLLGRAPGGLDWDHINRNKLDNRRENFRVATRSENKHNACMNKNNTSGVKGIYWNPKRKQWQAQIRVNYISYSSSYYETKGEAIEARKRLESFYVPSIYGKRL